MTGKFKPCMGILSPAQKRLWPALKNASNLGFVLYGGTAIALRLGHRDSVDFDFFSEKPLDRNGIKAAFPFMGQSTTLQDQDNTWVVLVSYGNSEQEHVISCPPLSGAGRQEWRHFPRRSDRGRHSRCCQSRSAIRETRVPCPQPGGRCAADGPESSPRPG